jgi:hypothetical protein
LINLFGHFFIHRCIGQSILSDHLDFNNRYGQEAMKNKKVLAIVCGVVVMIVVCALTANPQLGGVIGGMVILILWNI